MARWGAHPCRVRARPRCFLYGGTNVAAASRDQPSSKRRLPRGWWWRTRLAVLVTLLIVLAAAGVLHERHEHGSAAQWYADWFRDGLRGPYGAFPRSLPGPPSHAVRRAAVSFAGPGGVYAGVSVTWADGDAAVGRGRPGPASWRSLTSTQGAGRRNSRSRGSSARTGSSPSSARSPAMAPWSAWGGAPART